MDARRTSVKITSAIINSFYDMFINGKNRPAFFNIEKSYPDLLILDQNFYTIKSELSLLMQRNLSIPRYHEIDNYQTAISAELNPERSWRTFMINLMGDFTDDAQNIVPETCKLLKQIPNLFQAFFSILDPQKSIPAHKGTYRGYIRYHLGLQVPQNNTPKIRVKDSVYTWKEKESILFDDSWEHEVINHCNEERIVLIVDVLRPMPKIPHMLNTFISQHLVKKYYAKQLFSKLKTV